MQIVAVSYYSLADTLLTKTASSPLPIIGTEIPIAGFYWAAPLVLVCLYFYFHLYLLKLWEGLSGLPAIFPDGKRLDERAYPWLLNGLVRRHFILLKTERPFIAHIQEWITILLAWWVVPISMIAFWLRFIPRHDWWGTCFHIGLIVVSVAFAIIFYRSCANTLQRKEKSFFQLPNFWRDKRFYYGVCVILVGITLLWYSAAEINNTGVDFREKNISEVPHNYWEISEKKQLLSVKGANLKNRNLKNADMFKAFLVKADLRTADLRYANLMLADLQNANLRFADLQNARLIEANLHEANLQKADLYEANLQNAGLHEVNLLNAVLSDADFRYADLTGAKNLTIEQLSKVKTLYNAKLVPELMEQVKECCPHLLEKPKEESG